MPVKFTELVENFELMSMTSGDSHAYLCRQSGEFTVVWTRSTPEKRASCRKTSAMKKSTSRFDGACFERKATERALREWCELNSIERID